MPAAGVTELRAPRHAGTAGARRVLIPEMALSGARLMAAAFRAFGVPAEVMESYRGLALGKEFTSGKECFPCQVTLGDILHHLGREEERLGPAFDAGRYLYFMPEAGGPCRFGMYARFQRLVLERRPDYRGLAIVCLTTEDAYSAAGLVPAGEGRAFKKLAYAAVVMGDVLDRMVWRARPYERTPGAVDRLAGDALAALEAEVERHGRKLRFARFGALLGEAARSCSALRDAGAPRRPLIGIVGEIYLRSHPASNGDLIRRIESCGGEAVAASIAEWVNYISCLRAREERRRVGRALRRADGRGLARLRRWLSLEAERGWMAWRRDGFYRRARRRLDIVPDHGLRGLEASLKREDLYRFELGTEAPLSIGGALEYVRGGCDGVVNVYPFTCMPGTLASGILGPLLRRLRVPYLEAPCDDSMQPNREAALRTFLHQAAQNRDQRVSGA